MQKEKLNCSSLQKELEQMSNETKIKSVTLPTDISDFRNTTRGDTKYKVTPSIKLSSSNNHPF